LKGRCQRIFGVKSERGVILLGRFSAKYNPNERRTSGSISKYVKLAEEDRPDFASFRISVRFFVLIFHAGWSFIEK